MSRRPDLPQTLQECERRHQQLSTLLASVGFIWTGTLQQRRLTCGKPQCACHRDPDARHGPYYYWTTKKAQKTVSRKLSEEEAQILKHWIHNRRTVEGILKRMNEVAQRALDLLLRRTQGPD
jgi:hypothetical protein